MSLSIWHVEAQPGAPATRSAPDGGLQSWAVEVASLGYRTDLAVLRLGGSQVGDRGDHIVVSSPHVPTYWWGNFLLLSGVPDPNAAQGWVDMFATVFPSAHHVALGVDGVGGTRADLSWFSERGFSVDALAVMTAGRLDPPRRINRDAVYRELQSEDDWTASLALRLRCTTARRQAGSAPAELDTGQAVIGRRVVEAGHGRWFGAFVGGRLVAQLGLVATGDGCARYQSVQTDPDHRRVGLAGSLVHHAGLFGLSVMGTRTLVMVADPTYHAIELYRALGFQVAETQLIVERGDTA